MTQAGGGTRRLVSAEVIAEIGPIEGADAIERARVRGWDVVVKKGEMAVGDEVVYFEIDSALPLSDERFAFLEPRGAKTLADGAKVHVLKTAKLRGQYSQGLVLPLAAFPDLAGVDSGGLAEALDVVKYEPPIPTSLSGQVRGAFPGHLVKKTDAERVQNLTEVYERLLAEGSWFATEKIDGSSVTYIVTGDEQDPIRICSRNWELEPKPELTGMKIAQRYDLASLPAGTIVQGELYGEGIQANPLRVKGVELAVFGVFRGGTAIPRAEWPERLAALSAPVLDWDVPGSVQEAVEQVDGMASVVSPSRKAEGVVWHERSGKAFAELDGRSCWKAISNRYLIKNG
ncbi:RNA ligase (ATP) [Allokutzneria sp. NRRL B-24872]|uniref:RNA ligase (ATP) n=1 Tax=Allokutzneria sp. NRRL B-24872 TaxID=1137961 RepID=UPI00143CD34D|nr:RNA ligase (ATP) [Allokutzneria sp. NRRL B-24872]